MTTVPCTFTLSVVYMTADAMPSTGRDDAARRKDVLRLWHHEPMNQTFHVFLATGLSAGAAKPETEEQDLITQAFALTEVERMIRDSIITDSITVAAFGLLRWKKNIDVSICNRWAVGHDASSM